MLHDERSCGEVEGQVLCGVERTVVGVRVESLNLIFQTWSSAGQWHGLSYDHGSR